MPGKPKLIRSKKFIGMPPKSTNSLYDKNDKGMWYKTYAYRLFRELMLGLLRKDGFLPSDDGDWRGKGLYIEVGIIKEFDLDNTLKGIIDALQETYGFNDNCINGIIAKKNPVGEFPLTKDEWKSQYIHIGFIEYDNADCDIFEPTDFNRANYSEIKLPERITNNLFRSVTADWTNVQNSDANKRTVYPINLYPDLEEAAKILNLDVPTLAKMMKEIGAKYKFEKDLLIRLENKKITIKELKVALSHKIDKVAYEKLIGDLRLDDGQIEVK